MALRNRLQSLISVKDADTVTRVGHEEPGAFPTELIWSEAVKLYLEGLHPAIALSIRYQGRVVLDRTIGHVSNPPGCEEAGAIVTPETPFNLFSASKIVTAMVIHSLVEDGLLKLNERVVTYLPEFARHGKENVRLRHLLNHTAGIPDMPRDIDVAAALAEGKLSLDHLTNLRPSHAPGVNVAYHPMTSWFLLGEIVERVTGHDLQKHLVERLLDPLGFKRMRYGVPVSDIDLVAKHAITGPPVPGFVSRIFERTIGAKLDLAIDLTNRELFLTSLLPSANVIGTPSEVSRFMQMLLNGGELDGVRVLEVETVKRAITDVTPLQLDSTFGFPMRYGLGVMMGGSRFSLFGLGTRGAFGHLGLSTVVVYADPYRDLTVSFLNTGKPMLAPGMLRWYWVLQCIVSLIPRMKNPSPVLR